VDESVEAEDEEKYLIPFLRLIISLPVISSASASPPSKELSTSLIKDIAAFHLLRRMRILFGRPESYETFSSVTFSKVIGRFFAKDLCQVAETVRTFDLTTDLLAGRNGILSSFEHL
jgi:hypothetical protein